MATEWRALIALKMTVPNGKGILKNTSEGLSLSALTDFVPSNKFQGSKSGFVFRSGPEGLGYYRDGDKIQPNESGAEQPKVLSSSQVSVAEAGQRQMSPEDLLKEAEAKARESSGAVLALDDSGVARGANALVKAYSRNELQRSMHYSNPEKYMNSEVDLYDALTAIQGLAANPLLYTGLLVEYGDNKLSGAQIMTQCLAHENLDIVVASLQTWNELIDVAILDMENETELEASRRSITLLSTFFLDNHGLESLNSSLSRLEFQDSERLGVEQKVVFSFDSEMYKRGLDGILSLLETFLDLDIQQSAQHTLEQSPDQASFVSRLWESSPMLLACLLERIAGLSRNQEALSVDMMDITYNAAEVLATVFQNENSAKYCSSSMIRLPALTPVFQDETDLREARTKKARLDHNLNFVDGVEMLLQAVAPYRIKNPSSATECEFCENCVDTLAAAVLHGGVQIVEHFMQLEGIELMLRLVCSGLHAGNGALKVLNYCLSGSKNASNEQSEKEVYEQACSNFVETGGLKVLFPILMGNSAAIPVPTRYIEAGLDVKHISSNKKKLKRVKQAKREWLRQVEYNAVFVAYALTRYLRDSSPFDAKQRFLAKFIEQDCEKCDRIADLFMQYGSKMRQAEAKFLQSSEAEFAEEQGVNMDLATYNAKLNGGGDVCYRIGSIIAFVCSESQRCHNRILNHLHVNGSGISAVKLAVDEYANELNAGDQKSQLITLSKSI